MRPAALHPARGHRPYLGLEIDFGPLRAEHLAGPGRGQDREFKRPGGNALPLAQLQHERTDLVVLQGGMVLDRSHFGGAREQLIEAALPPRRIVSIPKVKGILDNRTGSVSDTATRSAV